MTEQLPPYEQPIEVPLVSFPLFHELILAIGQVPFDLDATVAALAPTIKKVNQNDIAGPMLEEHISRSIAHLMATNPQFAGVVYPYIVPNTQAFSFTRDKPGRTNVSAYEISPITGEPAQRTEYDALMLLPDAYRGGYLLGVIEAKVNGRGMVPANVLGNVDINRKLGPLAAVIREHPELHLSGIGYGLISIPDFSRSSNARMEQFRRNHGVAGSIAIPSIDIYNEQVKQAASMLRQRHP